MQEFSTKAYIEIKEIQLIFWDFDGVIKDSVQVKISSFCKLFEHYGLEVVEKIRVHNERNGGMSRYMKFPIYLDWRACHTDKNQ